VKAFLLAGGHGTRLRPLTDSVHKSLLPIRGKPLLDIWLEHCARCGISDVLINLHAHAEQIERHLAGTSAPVKVRTVREEQLLGSAGTVLANRDWIGTDAAFWILYSDVLTNTDLSRMVPVHFGGDSIATLGLYRVPDASRCGVAVANEAGTIIEFEEKPEKPRSDWAFSGIMLASTKLFEFIPDSYPADIGFHVLPRLVGKMKSHQITDYLLDIGTPENYRKAQETWPAEGSSEFRSRGVGQVQATARNYGRPYGQGSH
jgi:mannose-1-phosphate guanylyltransferase